MLTLDEAIKHAEKVEMDRINDIPFIKQGIEQGLDTEEDLQNCLKCADEHWQLAEWLKDYKRLKEQEPTRQKGEWIITHDGICRCSVCSNGIGSENKYYPFCHWCGADMRGEVQE